MKYIKKYENEEFFNEDDIVVSTITIRPYLIKGHRYVVVEDRGKVLVVKDIVNNEKSIIHKTRFVSENEWIYGENVNKYNL